MATLAQIADGLAATLEAEGIRCYAYRDENPAPPCVIVRIEGWELESMAAGTFTATFTLELLASLNSDRAAWNTLAALADPTAATGVASIIRANPTLGVAGVNAYVPAAQEFGSRASNDGSLRYAAVELALVVRAPGEV